MNWDGLGRSFSFEVMDDGEGVDIVTTVEAGTFLPDMIDEFNEFKDRYFDPFDENVFLDTNVIDDESV